MCRSRMHERGTPANASTTARPRPLASRLPRGSPHSLSLFILSSTGPTLEIKIRSAGFVHTGRVRHPDPVRNNGIYRVSRPTACLDCFQAEASSGRERRTRIRVGRLISRFTLRKALRLTRTRQGSGPCQTVSEGDSLIAIILSGHHLKALLITILTIRGGKPSRDGARAVEVNSAGLSARELG